MKNHRGSLHSWRAAGARQIRIAFINTHPIQYFAPLYADLNRAEDFSITALYLSDYSIRGASDRGFGQDIKWDVDLLAGYAARFVRGTARRGEPAGFFSVVAPELWQEVRHGAFDALVVHGHTPAAMLVAAAAAKMARIPIFLRCETHLGLPRSPIKNLLRRLLIGTCYRRLDGVLAIGSANREFHRTIGVPERLIFDMPYAVDNHRFITGAQLAASERKELRAGLGVHDSRPIVLFAAKFQHRKRPDDLLRAAARLNREGVVFHLAMVGSGEMETELHGLARHLGLSNAHFAGFVNQAALPRVYGACDVFVLPSENESWGLAINEAMCARLPIVASSEIGCVPDLVHDGRNGHTFSAGNVDELTKALQPLLIGPELRRRMGEASGNIIARWGYAECQAGLRTALASVGLGPVAAKGSPHSIEKSGPRFQTGAKPTPAFRPLCLKLAIVGGFDGTHVGGSLWRAATHLGIDTAKFDVGNASGNRILRAALWRFGDRRLPGMHRFSKSVVAACRRSTPDILIATGAAPLTDAALRTLRAMGVVCVNYSTDDPWNPALRAFWHLRSLPEYDAVFTTRRANIRGFADIGCGDVHYLPFGYDEWLSCGRARSSEGPAPDILFAGGADRDRVEFITEFLRTGPRITLVGRYWERFPAMRPYALGQWGPEALAALTAAAKVSLCLVRRANRDGHVMRSFEIAALGGCMLAEDTAEHREIFGADGDAVAYFRTPGEAAERARALLADPAERARLSDAVRARILRGAHTYRDRLVSIIEAATPTRRAQAKPSQPIVS